MPDIRLSATKRQPLRTQRGAAIFLLAAAALFLASAVLQSIASGQRWVVFAGSGAAGETSVEDHIFDYYFPYGDWEPIGTAAQFVGAGILIQAIGVLVMAIGVLMIPGTSTRWRALVSIGGFVLAVLIAASFGVSGTHAFISGINGAPSALQDFWALSHIGFFGLIALAMLWFRRLPSATAACLFLLGSTMVGYFVCTFAIAPLVAGETSHDTTRWTETIVAATTAAAGIAMILSTWSIARRGSRP